VSSGARRSSHARTVSCVKLKLRVRNISATIRGLSLYCRRHSTTSTAMSMGTCRWGFHAQTAGFFDVLASGSAYDQAVGTGSHTCPVMTPLLCFVVDALLHVDRSRGVGKQVFGDRPSTLANFVAAAPGNRVSSSSGTVNPVKLRTAKKRKRIAVLPCILQFSSLTRAWRPYFCPHEER